MNSLKTVIEREFIGYMAESTPGAKTMLKVFMRGVLVGLWLACKILRGEWVWRDPYDWDVVKNNKKEEANAEVRGSNCHADHRGPGVGR